MENTLVPSAPYVELQNQIKLFLAKELESRRTTIEEIMALLLIFSQTSSVEEIDAFIEIFKDTFPMLEEFSSGRTEGQKMEVKDKVKDAVLKMITIDPIRAGQLAKDAIDKNTPWEDLVTKYPELNEA